MNAKKRNAMPTANNNKIDYNFDRSKLSSLIKDCL